MLKHSTLYKKLGMTLALLLFLMVAFRFVLAYRQSRCPYCQTQLVEGQLYIWDCPAGIFTPVAPYLDRQSDVLWFQSGYSLPQMIHTAQGCGIAQFDADPPASARYCPSHTPPDCGDSRFLVIRTQLHSALYAPLREGEDLDWDGLRLRLNRGSQLDSWTVRVFWP